MSHPYDPTKRPANRHLTTRDAMFVLDSDLCEDVIAELMKCSKTTIRRIRTGVWKSESVAPEYHKAYRSSHWNF